MREALERCEGRSQMTGIANRSQQSYAYPLSHLLYALLQRRSFVVDEDGG